MSTSFTVATESFEGPLDLLLALIEKRKLLINDIALARVTDDFIAYVRAHPEYPLAETAHFILIGSTLLLIKSKSLLPILSLTEEEQASIDDLETRLKLYERIRALGAQLAPLYGRTRLYRGQGKRTGVPVFSPDSSMTLPAIQDAMARVLTNLPAREPKLSRATVQKILSLEEMIERLTKRVEAGMRTSFREFSGHGKGSAADRDVRALIVVSFLAVLELVKQGTVQVEQQGLFEDIYLETDRVGLPRYG